MQRFLIVALLALVYAGTLYSQTNIDGYVVDEQFQPLPGATVFVEGTERGTVTNNKGRFQLNIDREDAGRMLIISFLGYEPYRQPINILAELLASKKPIQLTPRNFTTEKVLVTATRARENTPVTYLNIEEEAIEERNLGQDVPYLLKFTPGVVVNSDAGTGIGYTGIWIRGSDPSRTNVTINGIPYNDSESQGVFWVNLPDFSGSANEIQIQRGVGTSTNGAGAFGATINFSTNQLNETPGISIDGSVGSFGTRRFSARYASGLMESGWSVEGRLSRTHSDGYIDRAEADLNGYYLAAGYVQGKSVWKFNAFGGSEVTYQAWNGVTDEELEQFGRTYNSVGTEKEGDPYDREVDDYGQNHYQLHYNTELTSQVGLGISGHYTQGAGYFEQYKAEESLADYGITADVDESDLIRRRWLDNDFYGVVYSLRYAAPVSSLELTFGGAANEYKGDHFGEVIWARHAGDSEIREPYYDNDAKKRDISEYARLNYNLLQKQGAVLNAYLDLQLRHVNYTFLGLDNSLNRVDQTENLTFFNPKVGLLHDFSKGQAYLTFGVANREPNRSDYVDNPSSTRPKSERLYNTELGVRSTRNSWNYSVNLYHMSYKDQLVLTGQLNDVGEYIRANVEKSYRLGLEISAGVQATPRLSVGGNVGLSRNRIKKYTEYQDSYDENFGWLGQTAVLREDVPLAFSPSLTGALELGYTFVNSETNKLKATLQAKYVGDRYIDNSGADNAILDAFHYADLRLNYSLSPKSDKWFFSKVRMTLMVRNLTDQLYFSNGWSYRYRFADTETLLRGRYPQAGSNLMFGLGFDF